MLIQAPCIVGLTWTLADGQGQPIDELTEPVEFFYGGDDLLPKLEEALAGQRSGFETHLHLEPEHAFGEYDAALVCFEDRALFAGHLEEGMQFEGLPEGAQTVGMPTEVVYTLTELYPSHVVLDANHPLAGVALQLQVKVQSVRAATSEEIETRSVSDSGLTLLSSPATPPKLH